MNSDQEILDKPEKAPTKIVQTNKRVYKDLMIVIGIAYLIMSLIMLYATYLMVSSTIDTIYLFGLSVWQVDWFKLLARCSPSLIYASYFIFGAIGLFRRSVRGWILSLSIAIFALVFPLVRLAIGLFNMNTSSDPFLWTLFFIVLGFGLVILFLVLKPTRNHFNLTPRSYKFVVASTVFLFLHLFTIPMMW